MNETITKHINKTIKLVFTDGNKGDSQRICKIINSDDKFIEIYWERGTELIPLKNIIRIEEIEK